VCALLNLRHRLFAAGRGRAGTRGFPGRSGRLRGHPGGPRKIRGVQEFDARTPSIARVYDYVLGGKDNFAADREAGDRIIAAFPAAVDVARENRQFLARAATWVANQGVGQFIDLGCGLPTAPNTHESVQAVRPDTAVVYVDNDPVAISHLKEVATKGSPSVTVVDGDLNDPDAILAAAAAGLDLGAPVCLIMGLLLHFYDSGAAHALVSRYCAALAPGSYLIISMAHGNGEEGERWFASYSVGSTRGYNYPVAEIAAFFDGTELVPPGVVDARHWRPGWSELPTLPFRAGQAICGVGRISSTVRRPSRAR
jgi:S-adenosyl methyltransferase